MTFLLTLFIATIGIILAICLFALNDFDFEKTMFKEEYNDGKE